MTIETPAIPGPAAQTPEWQAVHRTHITASALPAILGVSEYKTAFEQAAEMLGMKEPFVGNEATQRGHRYEKAIVSDYAETKGVSVEYPLPLYFHPAIAFLACSPDAVVLDERQFGLEAKLSMSPKRAAELGAEESDWVPDDWLVQVHGQMDVMEWDRVDFAVLLYGRLKVYRVHRNESLIESIHREAARFMELIQAGKLPEPDFAHASTPAVLKSLYRVESGESIDLDEEAAASWTHYQELGADEKELKAKREEHKARVLAALKTAEVGWLPDGRQLIRQAITRKSYSVAETTYTQLKERKGKR